MSLAHAHKTCRLLEENIKENRHLIGGRCSIHELEWGNAAHTAALQAAIGKSTAGRGVDLILGSDVLYDPRYHDVLLVCGVIGPGWVFLGNN